VGIKFELLGNLIWYFHSNQLLIFCKFGEIDIITLCVMNELGLGIDMREKGVKVGNLDVGINFEWIGILR
jgi:hypothetical protein